MARKLRVEYPGAIYHVMNRGDHREAIYRDDTDRQRFLGTLAEGCVKTGWHIHAFCLMGNHFHLVVEPFWLAGQSRACLPFPPCGSAFIRYPANTSQTRYNSSP